MKKSILLLIILINYSNLFSQVENAFVIENSEGSVLADNEILEFSSVEYDDASYNFYVRNLTSDEILLKAEVVSFTGTDGSGMEFCFGECYFGVIEGYSYPLAASVSVQPGQTQTSNGDHFLIRILGMEVLQLNILSDFIWLIKMEMKSLVRLNCRPTFP